MVRPTLLYETKYWLVKNIHIQKMNMLRWMCIHKLRTNLVNMGQGGNDPHDGNDEKNEPKMFYICEEEV